jgi:hypothetical protein
MVVIRLKLSNMNEQDEISFMSIKVENYDLETKFIRKK